jgi:lipopolysaccharide/colanic/teichoic acid biosynthesis glycosyltransferase
MRMGKIMENQNTSIDSVPAIDDGAATSRLAALRREIMLRRWGWSSYLQYLAKRILDVSVSASMMLALAPVLLPVALLIKLTDGGSVLFWQDRVGRHGRIFRFPKFRSMVTNAEAIQRDLDAQNQHGEGVTFKMKRDPRITWIGRIIRRASIDELPQLWCVLVGDMSLVGPRPPLPREVARYSLADRRRLECTPGLTCHWQVQGRSEIPFPRQVELDVDYIENQNIAVDVKLLAKTIPAVITGRGAY